MGKIILYIASSLDGYIARKNGEVDWLFSDDDYGYTEFLKSIGITLMGNNTYKQLLTFGEFPYHGKKNYVFTRNRSLQEDKNVIYVSENLIDFTRNLKNSANINIWLIGGTEIYDEMKRAGLVDEIILSIHPIILGDGIPLFLKSDKQIELVLQDCKTFKSGLVQVKYKAK